MGAPLIPLLIVSWLALGGLATAATPPQGDPFKPLLWVHARHREIPDLGPAIKRLGFVGINVGGGDDPAFAQEADLEFFVDPALPKGVLHIRSEPFRKATLRGLADPPDLRRPVGLDDPEVRNATRLRLAKRLAPFKGLRPCFVSIGDEISYTRLINPADWCQRRTSLAGFNRFLNSRWGSEHARMRGWGASGSLLPVFDTTAAARDRFFRSDPDPCALVPWNDARAYADERFADFVGFATAAVREIMPGIPVGFLGAQMPSAFGGFDYDRLLAEIDLIEPYEHGATPALIASLSPRVQRYRTIFLADRPERAVLQEIDHSFLRGDQGVIVFSSEQLFASQQTRPTLPGLGTHLHALAGDGPRAFRLGKPLKPAVAILHAMPSVRGHWMLDSAEDGASWIWRLTSHENKHTTQGRTRQAWVSLLEDLGLDYQFVTPEMIRAGALASPSLAALVLPRSIALSDAEAVAIQSFAMRGNLVCADAQAGLFNENLMRRRVGCLDALFGIKRSTSRTRLKTGRVRAPAAKAIPYPVSEPDLRPTTASVHGEAGQTPILLTAKFGSGTALYLNLLVMDYARDRLQAPPRAAWLRNELRRRLLMAGLRPRVHLVRKPDAPSWPVAARLRKVPGGYVLAFHLNVTTGGAAVPWKKIPTDTVVELEARLWKSFNIRNLDSGASLGRLRRFPVRVSASRPAFFQLFSKKP